MGYQGIGEYWGAGRGFGVMGKSGGVGVSGVHWRLAGSVGTQGPAWV